MYFLIKMFKIMFISNCNVFYFVYFKGILGNAFNQNDTAIVHRKSHVKCYVTFFKKTGFG